MKKSLLVLLLFVGFTCRAQSISDTTNIKTHLIALTKTQKSRAHYNIEQLNRSAAYIKDVFSKYSDHVLYQDYQAGGKTYKNVITSFGTEHEERIVIGAHYDLCGDQPGADDNASGVVGLLELARLLKGQKLNHRVDLVAYSLEEPPYFETEQMGSYIHAKSLEDKNAIVIGMVSLEMIGYFSDEKNSQGFPVGFLKLFYGSKGNFITLVKKFGSGKFARKFGRKFKSAKTVRTKKFTGPVSIPGIDLSDHRNYWIMGYSALMITDTSFYRNKNYHEATDTMETLDIPRMAAVIDAVYLALMGM